MSARKTAAEIAPGVPVVLSRALLLAGGPLALAKILGVSRNTVQRWKSGTRPLDGVALYAICAFVGLKTGPKTCPACGFDRSKLFDD